MTTNDILFVSGNAGKAAELAKWLGMPIEHRSIDVDEIQSLDSRQVVDYKARQAYAIVHQPVLVEDVAVTFTAMGRLPGTYIKWFLQELDLVGLCKLADGLEHRNATAAICYGLYDGTHIHFFEHSVPGSIAPEPRGESFGWNPIFIPDGSTKTYAEMTDDERRPHSMRAHAIDQLRAFLAAS